MRVFLSWSGETSKQVALALRDWLPDVIQALDPWMSAEDIDKGTRWAQALETELKNGAGIVCVTRDSVAAPWLNFEAGALAKAVERVHVIPYLHGLAATDYTGPLTLFQATAATHDDTRRMLGTLNRAIGERGLKEATLDKAFERTWPELEKRLAEIPAHAAAPKRRNLDEMVAEILSLVRSLAGRPVDATYTGSPVQEALFRRLVRDAEDLKGIGPFSRTYEQYLLDIARPDALEESKRLRKSARELLKDWRKEAAVPDKDDETE